MWRYFFILPLYRLPLSSLSQRPRTRPYPKELHIGNVVNLKTWHIHIKCTLSLFLWRLKLKWSSYKTQGTNFSDSDYLFRYLSVEVNERNFVGWDGSSV